MLVAGDRILEEAGKNGHASMATTSCINFDAPFQHGTYENVSPGGSERRENGRTRRAHKRKEKTKLNLNLLCGHLDDSLVRCHTLLCCLCCAAFGSGCCVVGEQAALSAWHFSGGRDSKFFVNGENDGNGGDGGMAALSFILLECCSVPE